MPIIRTNPVGESSVSSAQSTVKLLIPTSVGSIQGFSKAVPCQGLSTVTVVYRLWHIVNANNQDRMALVRLQGAVEQFPYLPPVDTLNWFNLTNSQVIVSGEHVPLFTGLQAPLEVVVNISVALAFIRVRCVQYNATVPVANPITLEAQLSLSQ